MRRSDPLETRRGNTSGARVVLVLLIAVVMCSCMHGEAPQNEQDPLASPEVAMARRAMIDARQTYFEDASVERGMKVVIGTAACQSAENCFSCYQCHGIRGAGSEAAGFPRLTRQSYHYLLKSLSDFAAGRRTNATMQAVAAGLSGQQMRDVAAYYSTMTDDRVAYKATSTVSPDRELMTEGARIANQGSTDGRLLSCAHCHGPAGVGRPPGYPYLAGQYAGYLEQQLRRFRDGRRGGTELQIMEELARRMTDEQIFAVSRYFSSLPPPSDEVSADATPGT